MDEGLNSNAAICSVDVAATLPVFDRTKVAKRLARRMLQGYQVTSVTCTDCGVPLLSHRGIVRCVVCVEELIFSSGSETEMGKARRESRNEESDGEPWRMARSVINVTEDGIELSPGMSTYTSIHHRDTGAPDAIEECVTDDIERMLDILDDETRSDEQYSFGSVSGTTSSRAEYDDGNNEISDESIALMISTLPVVKEQDIECEDGDNEISHANDALIISELPASGSPHRQLSHEVNEQNASTEFISEEKKGRREKLSAKNVEAENARLLEEIDELALAGNKESNRPFEETSQRSGRVPSESARVNMADTSTLECYAKGKAFATKIIQETDNILSDLVCTENQVTGANSNITNMNATRPVASMTAINATTLTMEVPTTKNTTNMSSVIPKSPTNAESTTAMTATTSAAAPPDLNRKRTTNEYLSKKNTASMSSIAPKSPTNSATTARMTSAAPSELKQKRTTINNLAKEHSAGRRKCYMPAWENSMRNFVFNDEESLIDDRNEQPPSPSGDKARPHRDDFFEELRHRALLTKVTSVQEKLEASGYVTKRNGTFSATPLIQVEKNDHDDIIESPLSCSTHASSIHDAANTQQLKQRQHQDKSWSTSKLIIPPQTTDKSKAALFDATLPDDEKKHLALKCIREEKISLPFDENIIASSQMNIPLSAATSATSVVYNGNKNGQSSGSSAQSLTSILSKAYSNIIQSNAELVNSKQIDENLSRKEEAVVVLSSSAGSTGSKNNPSSGSSAQSQKSRLREGHSNIIQPNTELVTAKQFDEILSRKEKGDVLISSSSVGSIGSKSTPSSGSSAQSILSKACNSTIQSNAKLVTAKQFDENLSRKEKVDVLLSPSSVGSNKNNRPSGSSVLSQRPTSVATTSVSPAVAPVETMSVEQFQAIANGLLERVESAVTKLKDYKQGIAGAEKEAVATPMVPSAAISVSSHPPLISIASLTSSVQVQQKRIEQFEADALHKHREAELAAASAREALDVMVKTRNDRREKIKAREQLGDGEKNSPTNPEVKSGSMCSSIGNNVAGKTELQPKDAKEGSTPRRDEDVYSAASASQNSRQESNHRCQYSNNANRKSDTQQFGDDGGVDINDNADESTIDDSTFGSHRRSKHRVTESIEECQVDNDNHPVMPGAGRNHRSMRPRNPRGYYDDEDTISEPSERNSSIADSVSSKSTISTFEKSNKKPSQRHRSLSASHVRRSEIIVSMKPHLLLPSLTSADPVDPSWPKKSVESSSPTRTSTAKLHTVQRTSSQHPKYSQSIPTSRSSLARTSQSMKPNHLLPYSPRRGYMDATPCKGARLTEARMPESLSRRTESEPFSRDHHHQRPMMSQYLRESRSTDNGYGLPRFLPKGQYSNSLVDSSSLISAIGLTPFRHGSLSLTPMSLYEREQFGFNTQQPSANPHPTPKTFDALLFAKHQTFGERKASMSQEVMAPIPEQRPSANPRPTTRDFDSLLLAQHQRIEEVMGSNNQETMARERPSGILPPMIRDFDSLLLAHNQIIGERMTAANQEAMASEQQPSGNPRSTTRDFNSLLFAHNQMIGEPMAPVNQHTMAWQHFGSAPTAAAGTTQPLATGEHTAYINHEAMARRQCSGVSAAVMASMDQDTMAPQHFVDASVATAATGQPFMTGGRHNAPIAAGYHHPTMLSLHSSHTGRCGYNANRKSDTQQFGDDGGVDFNVSADESAIDDSSFDELSTSSSYLSKLRGVSEERRRTLVQRSHMRSSPRAYYDDQDTISESSER